jgi:hypothetical protein
LTSYYVTDATFGGAPPAYYYQIVQGGGGGGSFGDFNAKFPDGATIAPGEHQTIAMSGSDGFNTTYGVDPTYELFEDGAQADAIPDMLEATTGSINGQGGLSNDGEVIILYYWDGASDLVMDVDYVVWGDKAEAVDKTGVSIDGPDAASDATTYASDTAILDQTIVNTDNDEDGNPHDDGMSAQRLLDVEDLEMWTGGNGITGHDETSENTSWKGGIWSLNIPATPGTRAAGKPASDSLTIADIQFVRAAGIGTDVNAAFDDSPFVGDTLSLTGILMQGPREVFLGNRWGGFMQDPRGGPWSGFFIIQNDTTAGKESTLLPAAQTGDVIRVTGIMSEFPTGASQASITQFVLITDPVTPIEFIDFGLPLPDPIILTPGDLGFDGGNSANPELSERWEGVLARFENLTVTANGLPGNTLQASDGTGSIILDDYFNGLSIQITNNGGVWPGLPAGTVVNVTGIVRGGTSSGFITINPRSLADVEIASAPPEITNISRLPVVPSSSESVAISTILRAGGSAVAGGSVFYRVNGGVYTEVAMTTTDSVYTATIPVQANQDTVEYFLKATGADGFSSLAPGDTSAARFFYIVRDGGLTIADVQYTPFANGNSPYDDLEVTVTGIATTDSSDFAFYWIQDGIDPWSGVWINDSNTNVKLGDEVRVTGIVEENFNATRINVTAAEILSTGNTVPAPIVLPTGDLATGSPVTESYEGMLVQVQNVGVSNPFSDGSSNFGEFTIDDGSGGVRVDDIGNFRGNLDSTFALGDSLMSLTGIHHFTFSNYKIEPRNDSDIARKPVSVEEDKSLPLTFALAQNYPNPFNPETTIEFQIATLSDVKLEVFNVLGQKVRTLVNEATQPGRYKVTWRGVNDFGLPVASGVYVYQITAGEFVQVQKMLFLK